MKVPSPVVPDGPLIVGVDETPHSRDAIALGQQLVLGLPGGLIAVYVHTLEELDALMAGHDPEEFERLVVDDATAKQAELRPLVEDMGASDLQLRRGTSAAAGLYNQAIESNAAMVVLGSSSRSGLGRVLPGGTAERLLSGSPVPVAVAPNGYSDREERREAIGVGFNESPEARDAVSWAAGLASRSGTALHLLAVHKPLAFGGKAAGGVYGTKTVNQVLVEDLQSASEQVAEALSADLSVEKHLLRGDPAKVLAERSEKLDLLVLGSRGYGPLKSVLLGSVSSYVIRNAHCPILVVPSGRKAEEDT